MLLWICFAVLTAAVVAALMQPLRRDAGGAVEAAAADLAVYRNQLAEIDAERERGLISESEVQGARTEVARRLIARAGTETAPARAGDNRSTRAVFLSLATLIPIASVATYLALGAPQEPALPFAARQNVPIEQASIADLVARIETRLKEAPGDGTGWDVVAPIYLKLQRYADAAHAYAEAGRILGESPKRLVGFAEATLFANNGVVSEEVRRTAERILALEPGRAEARIWLALAKEQDGDLPGATAAYREVVASAPADAPWREAITERIDLLARRMSGEAPPAATAEGPTKEDADRVAAMNPDEQSKFIGSMVDGLAARLKQDGKDLAGWLKLVRAYKVLGRNTDAVAALSEARRNFDGDRKSLDELDELAKGLGLGS